MLLRIKIQKRRLNFVQYASKWHRAVMVGVSLAHILEFMDQNMSQGPRPLWCSSAFPRLCLGTKSGGQFLENLVARQKFRRIL
jgi:hypothetical protein